MPDYAQLTANEAFPHAIHPEAYGLILTGNPAEVAAGSTLFIEPTLPKVGDIAVVYPKDGSPPLIAAPLTSCERLVFSADSGCSPAIMFEHIDVKARCFSIPQKHIEKIHRVFFIREPNLALLQAAE